MQQLTRLEPVDYLVIGHLTCDLSPEGPHLGGTAAFAALTAQALGLRVGIVTSLGEDVPMGAIRHLPIVNFPTENSTTFENITTPEGRVQFIHHVAPSLGLNLVPDPWHTAPIVHLGPVAQEVEPALVRHFPTSLIGVTPQGWLRSWNSKGRVLPTEWPEAAFVLQRAGAAVLSIEDVDGEEDRLAEMAASCHILAVTEAEQGSRLYWNGDVRRFSSPKVKKVDDTGAGDIYAAAFFVRLYTTRDPWEAARFATLLASYSVTRSGLESIPTADEIQESMVEVL
jgi:sugar/nucleoside kinase (ribokinase family)